MRETPRADVVHPSRDGERRAIEVEATVMTALPNAMFKLRVDVGGASKEILGHVSGKMRKHFIRIVPGDKVALELSPYDSTKARIIFREQ